MVSVPYEKQDLLWVFCDIELDMVPSSPLNDGSAVHKARKVGKTY